MLASESKIRELAESIKEVQRVVEEVTNKANVNIDETRIFVQEVEGRFTQLGRVLPERIHVVEKKSENFITIANDLTGYLQNKFRKLEETMRKINERNGGHTGATSTIKHVGIGSPLSGPGTDDQSDQWANFAQSKSA